MKFDEYVEQFKKNDYSRFDDFYKLTQKQVFFTALGILKDATLAEDVMHDTYVSFLENIDSYKKGANIYAYLTVIARNKSINFYNKNKRVSFDDDALTNIKTEQNFDTGGVDAILNLLDKEEDREIITYHVILGYKFIEIASIMNTPLGTVLWRYNKAMKLLREKVGEFYDE